MKCSVNSNYRTSPRRSKDNDDIWQIKLPNYRKLNDCNANISKERTTDSHKNQKKRNSNFYYGTN